MITDIFKELEQLSLGPADYIVLGSGILAALEIRPTQDIDLLITRDAFERLCSLGWKYEEKTFDDGMARDFVMDGDVEACSEDWDGKGVGDYRKQPGMITTIRGIDFGSLEQLRAIKALWGRAKDRRDVELIDGYLKSRS